MADVLTWFREDWVNHIQPATQIVAKFFLDPHLTKCRWGTHILGISTLWFTYYKWFMPIDTVVAWRDKKQPESIVVETANWSILGSSWQFEKPNHVLGILKHVSIHACFYIDVLHLFSFFDTLICFPDSKVNGANMGSIWGQQDPGGPHVGPINFVIWVSFYSKYLPNS